MAAAVAALRKILLQERHLLLVELAVVEMVDIPTAARRVSISRKTAAQILEVEQAVLLQVAPAQMVVQVLLFCDIQTI
jgi:hypothetical protein